MINGSNHRALRQPDEVNKIDPWPRGHEDIPVLPLLGHNGMAYWWLMPDVWLLYFPIHSPHVKQKHIEADSHPPFTGLALSQFGNRFRTVSKACGQWRHLKHAFVLIRCEVRWQLQLRLLFCSFVLHSFGWDGRQNDRSRSRTTRLLHRCNGDLDAFDDQQKGDLHGSSLLCG